MQILHVFVPMGTYLNQMHNVEVLLDRYTFFHRGRLKGGPERVLIPRKPGHIIEGQSPGPGPESPEVMPNRPNEGVWSESRRILGIEREIATGMRAHVWRRDLMILSGHRIEVLLGRKKIILEAWWRGSRGPQTRA